MKDKIIQRANKILENDTAKKIYNKLFLDKLIQKTVKININDIDFDLCLKFTSDNIVLSEMQDKVDVEISGSLPSFIFYASTGNELLSSKIKISGDVETANALNGLIKETDILRDITVEIIGQKSSSTLFSILDPIKSKIDDSNKKNNDALSDFLKYDIDLIPTKEDINNYIDQVDEIKSRTERLMAKVKWAIFLEFLK